MSLNNAKLRDAIEATPVRSIESTMRMTVGSMVKWTNRMVMPTSIESATVLHLHMQNYVRYRTLTPTLCMPTFRTRLK